MSVRIQYCTDSVPVQIHWKTVTTIRISEISNTVLIWVPVWTEWAEMRRYKLEHARARARGKDGDCKLPAWRSVVKMLMDGNLLVLFGATRGDLVRVRALPCSRPCSKSGSRFGVGE